MVVDIMEFMMDIMTLRQETRSMNATRSLVYQSPTPVQPIVYHFNCRYTFDDRHNWLAEF